MARKTDELNDLLVDVLGLMGLHADVTVEETDDGLRANLAGPDVGVLIGGRGKTLNALQCLVNVAINHGDDDWKRVVVDAEGYRERRRESLEKYALKTAEQVLEEGREISLEPMNSYERRIVHCALMDRDDVVTDSRGEEPYRFIVIGPAGLKAE